MGIFNHGKTGGIINVIRCDEKDYLVWKWRPAGQPVNTTSRENAIRWGSSLRVKDGEMAVFVYQKADGTVEEFIKGPYDGVLETSNLPLISDLVQAFYGGYSPFQADIYFINLQRNNQIAFGIPYFDMFDPRFPDFGVPMAVRGRLTFNITKPKEFIKLNRMVDFSLQDFETQIKNAITRYIKNAVIKLPAELGIPLIQIEKEIGEINLRVEEELKPRLENDFGINVRGLDISTLDIDKESEYYEALYHLTAENLARTVDSQTDVNIKNLQDTQAINAQNMEETLRIQREEFQRAQRLQMEQNFIGAHALDLQAEVLKTAAQNLGQMGNIDLNGGGDGNGGGFNPAGIMTGMMMGGAMGSQMAGMMNQMGSKMQGSMNTPPPIPPTLYMIASGGQAMGPFTPDQLQQLVNQGDFTADSYVWTQGMAQWEKAGNVPELVNLFNVSPSPTTPPGMPQPPQS